MTAHEDIAFITGSEVRIAVLHALRTTTATPTTLAEECSCARETAQRTVSAFVERGWAEKVSTKEGYRLTRAGELIAESYEEFERCIEVSDKFRKFLANLRGSAPNLDCALLSGATAAKATVESPHAPIERFLAVVDDGTVETFRGVTPIVSRVFNRAAGRVIGQDSEVELIVDQDVLSASASEYPDALSRAEELPGFTLLVSPEPLEFGLMIIDGHAYVGAYDDEGNLVASADSDDEAFVAWAEQTFSRIQAEAEPWS
ncbi:MAG: helix-turn-helix transcriptional regulator [Halobellus sp.]|uniref:helix-turn-helix transcriptional regulator n=1 Tax=Halobellus sp. TaxID=1979212 RepID=UPI0035D4211B